MGAEWMTASVLSVISSHADVGRSRVSISHVTLLQTIHRLSVSSGIGVGGLCCVDLTLVHFTRGGSLK